MILRSMAQETFQSAASVCLDSYRRRVSQKLIMATYTTADVPDVVIGWQLIIVTVIISDHGQSVVSTSTWKSAWCVVAEFCK